MDSILFFLMYIMIGVWIIVFLLFSMFSYVYYVLGREFVVKKDSKYWT
jgi:hypothetical protein